MNVKKQILKAFNFRYACKEFDAKRKISDDDFYVILEAGRLSPSSFGLEPWKFLVLQNMELREKIRAVSWGAQGQLPTASHFIIILARKAKDLRYNSEYLVKFRQEVKGMSLDLIKAKQERMRSFQEKDFDLWDDRALFDWACKQTYIALGNMMTVAALLGIDSCPIEGFNREELENILAKEGILDRKSFGVSCMVAFGYRAAEHKEAKTRQNLDKMSEWIK